jgi:hypothetical protein
MNITSDRPITIYRFEDNGKVKYTFGVGKKIKDTNDYENAFYPIQFKQGVDLKDKSKITVKKAWLSFYSWEYQGKKGNTFYVMCSEFELAEEEVKEVKKVEVDIFAQFGETVSLENNDFLD